MDALVIEQCGCENCKPMTAVVKEEEKTFEKEFFDCYFEDIQRQIRLIKIKQASLEKTYLRLLKLKNKFQKEKDEKKRVKKSSSLSS